VRGKWFVTGYGYVMLYKKQEDRYESESGEMKTSSDGGRSDRDKVYEYDVKCYSVINSCI
jgi:hypothetical protein